MFSTTSQSKLNPAERRERALRDLEELHRPKAKGWIVKTWDNLVNKFNHLVDVAVDVYTSSEYWLHTNYPRGYIVVFLFISLASSGIYVFDIVTDVLVAQDLLKKGLTMEGAVVATIAVWHYAVIAYMLGRKLYYYFDESVMARIDTFRLYDETDEQLQARWQAAHAHASDSASRETSVFAQRSAKDSVGPAWYAHVATIVLQYLVKAGAVLLFGVTLMLSIPFLDFSMLFVELLSAVSSSGISSKRAEHATAFQNFLLQYQTIRIPSECFLESLPQAAFQGYMYARSKVDPEKYDLTTHTIVQSIVVSFINLCKNLLDIWVAYKVSGFTLPSYMANALAFEGAAQLPFRWNSQRSSLAERLVLTDDFVTLAHAQKMKMFQAALMRPSICITNTEADALGEECVLVVSSWELLGFISDMLPVSLSDGNSSSQLTVALKQLDSLALRDDARHVSASKAAKMQMSVRWSLLEFLNAPTIWLNLDRVLLQDCGLEGEDVDALTELLLRDRVHLLDLSGNPLGDVGLAAMCDGFLGNTSLTTLVLARTRISEAGAYHLAQGLSEHASLTSLSVAWNRMGAGGVEHMSDLVHTLPTLTALDVTATGMGPDALAALVPALAAMTALTSLNLSHNPGLSHPLAVDDLACLLGPCSHLRRVGLASCALPIATLNELLAALGRNPHITALDLSGMCLQPATVTSLCTALRSRANLEEASYFLGSASSTATSQRSSPTRRSIGQQLGLPSDPGVRHDDSGVGQGTGGEGAGVGADNNGHATTLQSPVSAPGYTNPSSSSSPRGPAVLLQPGPGSSGRPQSSPHTAQYVRQLSRFAGESGDLGARRQKSHVFVRQDEEHTRQPGSLASSSSASGPGPVGVSGPSSQGLGSVEGGQLAEGAGVNPADDERVGDTRDGRLPSTGPSPGATAGLASAPGGRPSLESRPSHQPSGKPPRAPSLPRSPVDSHSPGTTPGGPVAEGVEGGQGLSTPRASTSSRASKRNQVVPVNGDAPVLLAPGAAAEAVVASSALGAGLLPGQGLQGLSQDVQDRDRGAATGPGLTLPITPSGAGEVIAAAVARTPPSMIAHTSPFAAKGGMVAASPSPSPALAPGPPQPHAAPPGARAADQEKPHVAAGQQSGMSSSTNSASQLGQHPQTQTQQAASGPGVRSSLEGRLSNSAGPKIQMCEVPPLTEDVTALKLPRRAVSGRVHFQDSDVGPGATSSDTGGLARRKRPPPRRSSLIDQLARQGSIPVTSSGGLSSQAQGQGSLGSTQSLAPKASMFGSVAKRTMSALMFMRQSSQAKSLDGQGSDAGSSLPDSMKEAPPPSRPLGPHLKELRLSSCSLEAQDIHQLVAVLKEVLGLSILDLSGSPIDDGGLASLVQLIHATRSSLTTLLLPRCGLSAWGLSRPGAAFSLRLVTELDLSGNPLGDEGMEQLCFQVLEAGDVSTLTVLRLCAANVGASGFNHLLTGLLVNTSIQQLYLSHNFIGGFEPTKFDRFQSVNRSLKLLDLRYNRLTAPWAAHMKMSLSLGTRRLLLL